MKPTPYHFLLLLCCLISAYTLRAQDTSKIPSLKVWYEIPNVWNTSYLEKFDTANGGNGALVLNRSWGEGQTIYMQGRGDTTNRFTWERWGGMGGGQYVETVDFNGDGVNDYLQGDGIIYRGKTKNAPPESIPVARYDITFYGIGRRCVADFNDDGKEDFLSGIVSGNTLGEAPGPFIGRIILGNSDLTKMKVLEMPVVKGVAEDIQNIVSAWRENGKNYLVLYEYTPDTFDPRSDGFVLYEFTITADSAVHYTELDYIPFKSWPSNVVPYYSYSSSFVWHSRDMKEHTLSCVNMVDRSTYVYRIVNGRFSYRWTETRPWGPSYPLQIGISNKHSNGYGRAYDQLVYVYDGNPADDSLAQAWFPLYYNEDGFETMCSCGDVNADGFGDFAAIYTGISTAKLLIYLGSAGFSNVDDHDSTELALTLASENPTSNSQAIDVTITVGKPGLYTLDIYSMRGEHIATVLNEHLERGRFQRSVPMMRLVTGFYNIRLSGGGHSIDKGLMIVP